MHVLRLMKEHNYDYTGIQPYIFEPSDEETTHLFPYEGIIASPFPKFSIELNKRPLTSMFDTFQTNVIFCEELGVDDYFFIIDQCIGTNQFYIEVTKDKLSVFKDGKLAKTQPAGTAYEKYKRLVHIYLERLRACRWGLVNSTGKAKYKNSLNQKCTYVPKDVIYVSNTEKKAKSTPRDINQTQRVRWQESWDVEAHWRKINQDSLGLDRYGDRCVKGYTWICNYEKGEGAKILKTRKVR